jgi:hypothetical protein
MCAHVGHHEGIQASRLNDDRISTFPTFSNPNRLPSHSRAKQKTTTYRWQQHLDQHDMKRSRSPLRNPDPHQPTRTNKTKKKHQVTALHARISTLVNSGPQWHDGLHPPAPSDLPAQAGCIATSSGFGRATNSLATMEKNRVKRKRKKTAGASTRLEGGKSVIGIRKVSAHVACGYNASVRQRRSREANNARNPPGQ